MNPRKLSLVVVLSIVMCLAFQFESLAAITHSMEIRPSHPNESWSVDLPPMVTAEVTITVSTDPGWTLTSGPTESITGSDPALLWTKVGSVFKVTNTATTPQWTKLEIACQWTETPTGTASGSGAVDAIDGLATAMANLKTATHLVWTFAPPVQLVTKRIYWSVSAVDSSGNTVAAVYHSVCPATVAWALASGSWTFGPAVRTCSCGSCDHSAGSAVTSLGGWVTASQPCSGVLQANYTPYGGAATTEAASTTLIFASITGDDKVMIGQATTLTVSPAGVTYLWSGVPNLKVEGADNAQAVTLRAGALGAWEKISLSYTGVGGSYGKLTRQVKVQRPTSDAIVWGIGVDSVEVDPFGDGPPAIMRVDLTFEVRDQDGDPIRGNGHAIEERISRPQYGFDSGWVVLPNGVGNDGRTVDPKITKLDSQADINSWNQTGVGTQIDDFVQRNRMVINAGGGLVTIEFGQHQLKRQKSTATSFQVVQ